MLISTVITRPDWSRIEQAWTAALRRFELEQDWEILQITDEGGMRKFSLKANKHDDHEQTEICVDIHVHTRQTDVGPEETAHWDATRQCTELPSCRIKYVEVCNSRTGGVVRLTPDEPFHVAAGM